jgi:5-methylcytosine-specific restriction enzyme A
MALKASTYCREPGCRSLVSDRSGYCSAHARVFDAPDDFYRSPAWVKTRRLKLRRTPLCERCTAQGRHEVARMVHHRIPRNKRPDLELLIENLESLCLTCHAKLEAGVRAKEKKQSTYDFGRRKRWSNL